MQLTLLQGLVRRDPIAYKEEFLTQLKSLEAEVQLLRIQPSRYSDRLVELLEFTSHTVVCYEDEATQYFSLLLSVLESFYQLMHPDIRLKLFQSAVLVKSKINVDQLILLKLSFRLLSLNDKVFRSHLLKFILSDVKLLSKGKNSSQYNRQIQSFIHKFISEETSLTAQKSVEVISELYRRRIWSDARTVNIIASACTNPSNKVSIAAISFFLGIDTLMAEDEEEEVTAVNKDDLNLHEHSKKTKKRERDVKRQKAKAAKLQRDVKKNKENQGPLLPAIVMINDPHSLAEHIFKKIRSGGEKFDQKLLMMNFVSQLIGCHKLILLSFYSFLQKYLTSHQNNVTVIMVYLIQSCHELVPPQELLPIVKCIAFNFITDRSSEESLALGLNTVREIFARAPSLLLEDDMDDFVQDLALYSHKQKKCVVSAARSLINFVREKHPKLLKRDDRGKDTDKTAKPLPYGMTKLVEKLDSSSDDDGDLDDDEWETSSEMSDENSKGMDGSEGNDSDSDSFIDIEDQEEDDEGNLEESEFEDEEQDDEDQLEDDQEEEDGEGDIEEEVEEDVSVQENAIQSKKDKSKLKASKLMSKDDVDFVKQMKKKRLREEYPSDSESDASGSEHEEDDESGGFEYVVDPSSLVPSGRLHKATKIEKMKKILEGRNPVKFVHGGHAGGLTNKEKQRKKNYLMVRRGKRSVAQKTRRSLSDVRAAKNSKREIYGRDKRKRRRT